MMEIQKIFNFLETNEYKNRRKYNINNRININRYNNNTDYFKKRYKNGFMLGKKLKTLKYFLLKEYFKDILPNDCISVIEIYFQIDV